MDMRQETSTSSVPPMKPDMGTPSLKEIFRGDSELVDFFRFVSQEGYREKAHQMILDRILKRKSS